MERSKPKVATRKHKGSPEIQAIGEDLVRHPGSYVFIVGAGASAPAGVPTARALKKDLTKGFQDEMLSKLNEWCKERGEHPYSNLDEAALEVLLPIYAEIVGGDNPMEEFLRGHLERFLGEKKFPPLGYEILAHLMNHGLVKHLVSMNFDELLELALDEELGEPNYEKVRSMSQFTKLLDDEEENDQEDKKISERKILLKPHGTISLSATLRIELHKVFNFEKEKSDVLEKVFREKNVIFIGYNFLDPDIRKLTWRLAQGRRLKQVYFVHSNKDLLSKNNNINELLSSQITSGLAGVFIPKDSDKFVEELALAIEKTKEGGYLPKITRHRIRNLIFQKEGLDPTPPNKLLVEILIFALKVKGKFKTKALLSCERIKYYARELSKRRGKGDGDFSSVYTILWKLQNEGILLIQEGKNNEVYDIGGEVCYLIGPTMEKGEQEEQLVKEEVVSNIVNKLAGLLGKPYVTLDNALNQLMKDLVEDFDYDLVIGLHPFEFSFESADHKENPIEFRKRLIALEILENAVDEQENCYIIAETGEWLLKETVSIDILKSKSVRIILSDYQKDPLNSLHRSRAERVYRNLVDRCKPNTNIRFLNWDLNKHHGTFSNKRCIYFYKEGKPPTLQPLELTYKADTERLMKLCDYLWDMCDK